MAADGARARPPDAWRDSFDVVVLTRVVFLVVAWAAAWFLARGTGDPPTAFLDLWNRWDARHFEQVALYGYTDPRTDPHATAFFPLFPLLVRAIAAVGVDTVVAGMTVSAVASVVAGAYLFRIAEDDIGPGAGRRAVAYLALFPTAVFLVAPYSEALFLAGATGAFHHARAGRWLRAGFPAAVAMGSRIAGVFLLAGLAAEFLARRDRSGRDAAHALAGAALAAAPLVCFAAYLWAVKGDPWYFLTDQRLGWGRTFTDPVTAFTRTWQTWGEASYPSNFLVAWRGEIVAAGAGVAFTAWAAVRREWGYAVYMGTMLAALLTSTWYYSIPRMLLVLFPIPVLLSSLAAGDPRRHDLVLVLLAPLATLGVVVFTQGGWFY